VTSGTSGAWWAVGKQGVPSRNESDIAGLTGRGGASNRDTSIDSPGTAVKDPKKNVKLPGYYRPAGSDGGCGRVRQQISKELRLNFPHCGSRTVPLTRYLHKATFFCRLCSYLKTQVSRSRRIMIQKVESQDINQPFEPLKPLTFLLDGGFINQRPTGVGVTRVPRSRSRGLGDVPTAGKRRC